ncbi:zf-HC2 domain-containing protein [Clostridium sp. D2Q-11]|uniref:Zf-HC2 domain-containing protein n=1 Tax=Anaeromonas frigoriresistens TaxID=2683708 RepID=A0A942USW7_9FIRM|nr:zf-HC2 domain-containing protein [Anaeromonas frigoriresistens]MBS4537973.1 zf-HC2 domain-containing protein [Anaeromonas frigoriresistens]
MDCKEVQKNIDRYIENKLDIKNKILFENHIDSCHICKREFEDIRYIFSELNESISINPPPNFTSNIMKKINKNKVMTFNKSRKIWGASLVAAGFLLFFINNFASEIDVNTLSRNLYLNSINVNKKIVKPFGDISELINIPFDRLNEEDIK